MKAKRSLLKYYVILLIIFSGVNSCTKEKQAPVYDYFVSKEVSLNLTKAYLSGMIDIVSESNPEVAGLKPLIAHDVVVYKIVYKTEVNGEQINASGLVCVPSDHGAYPVLSFQNGTNTVNAYCPTQFPSDFNYQMIEMIASLGYVVVIADYPGFGASSSIPHPYLVKEPTVRSLVDILYTVKEMAGSELSGISLNNDYYLLGYSQGGWATLALDKALEVDYSSDFNLRGSACGAGPYNIYLLMQDMINVTDYPMPVYLGYIVNAYSYYNQFTNPVSDIFNEPYSSLINSLYNGLLTSSQINSQLTTNIADLITPGFLSGFESASEYSSVRQSLVNNSIAAWHSYKPLLLLHGENDTHVNPVSTENIYNSMLLEGTSADIITRVIIPGADHGSGVVPAMVQGILFLNGIKDSE